MKKILLAALSVLALGGLTYADYNKKYDQRGWSNCEGEKHKGRYHKHKKGKSMRLEKFDTNADGVISQDEFISNANERFSKMDLNADGQINQEEVQQYHRNMKKDRKRHKNRW